MPASGATPGVDEKMAEACTKLGAVSLTLSAALNDISGSLALS